MKNKIGTILQASVKSLEFRQKRENFWGYENTTDSWSLFTAKLIVDHTIFVIRTARRTKIVLIGPGVHIDNTIQHNHVSM